tara:strand:- start:567 stop:3515 length:2949 start_codon:yes stop_codon:yes gene_type:complete
MQTFEEERTFFQELIDPFQPLNKNDDEIVGAKLSMSAAFAQLTELVRTFHGEHTQNDDYSKIETQEMLQTASKKYLKAIYAIEERLGMLQDALLHRCHISIVICPESLNPLKTFEALNTRGLELQPLDTMRSYLMRMAEQISSQSVHVALCKVAKSITSEAIREKAIISTLKGLVGESEEKKKLEKELDAIRAKQREDDKPENKVEDTMAIFTDATKMFLMRIEKLFGSIQKAMASDNSSTSRGHEILHPNASYQSHSSKRESYLLNLHYYLVWVLPWLLRNRTVEKIGSSDRSDEDVVNLTDADLGREYMRVIGFDRLDQELIFHQLNEQVKGKIWISGTKQKTGTVNGAFVQMGGKCTYFNSLFPDLELDMENSKMMEHHRKVALPGSKTRDGTDTHDGEKRKVQLAHLLCCRMHYYLESLESFMMTMLPLGQGDRLLRLNYAGIPAKYKVPWSDELHCQEIVRSLFLADLGEVTEVVLGMLALHPMRFFDNEPRKRAELFCMVLQTLRTVAVRNELISLKKDSPNQPKISLTKSKTRLAMYVRCFAHVIPLHKTLGYYERIGYEGFTVHSTLQMDMHDCYCFNRGTKQSGTKHHQYRCPAPEYNTWFEGNPHNPFSYPQALQKTWSSFHGTGVRNARNDGQRKYQEASRTETSTLLGVRTNNARNFEADFKNLNAAEQQTSPTRYARFKSALRCVMYLYECKFYHPHKIFLRGQNGDGYDYKTVENHIRESFQNTNEDNINRHLGIELEFREYKGGSKVGPIIDVQLSLGQNNMSSGKRNTLLEDAVKKLHKRMRDEDGDSSCVSGVEIRIWPKTWRQMIEFTLQGQKSTRRNTFDDETVPLSSNSAPEIEHAMPLAYAKCEAESRLASARENRYHRSDDERYFHNLTDAVGNFFLVCKEENNRVRGEILARPEKEYRDKMKLYADSGFAALREAAGFGANDWEELIEKRESELKPFLDQWFPTQYSKSWPERTEKSNS